MHIKGAVTEESPLKAGAVRGLRVHLRMDVRVAVLLRVLQAQQGRPVSLNRYIHGHRLTSLQRHLSY